MFLPQKARILNYFLKNFPNENVYFLCNISVLIKKSSREYSEKEAVRCIK